MKTYAKYLSIIGIGLVAINSYADYSLGVTSGSSVPSTVSPNNPSTQSGKTTFTVSFAGGSGTWNSAQLGGGSAANPTSYDSWFSATGALGLHPSSASNVNGYNGSYFQILSDQGYFTSITIDPASTLLLNQNGGLTGGGKTYSGNSTLNLVVDWTVDSSQTAGDKFDIVFKFAAFAPGASGGGNQITVSSNARIDVAAVPEPGQALAGAVLLGCGALVFTGRRWMKAQAAK